MSVRAHQFAAVAFEENLSLRDLLPSWPGARADVSVTYPPARPFRKRVRLNWDGHSSLQVPVRIELPPSTQSLKAVVEVRAHLQDRDSKVVSKNFVVIR